jgi:hypothetical protein
LPILLILILAYELSLISNALAAHNKHGMIEPLPPHRRERLELLHLRSPQFTLDP